MDDFKAEHLLMADLRHEDGFSLPELLVTLMIASVVSLAAFALVDFTMTRAAEVQDRVETSQRARATMDTMTRELRSQVCLNAAVPPMAAPSDSNTATFFMDLTDGSDPNRAPEMHTLVYDANARTITDRTYVGVSNGANPPTFNYPALNAPTRTRTLLTSVVPYRADGATQDTPIFQYFAFNQADPPRPELALPAAAGLAPADLGRVASIRITYKAIPQRQPKNATKQLRGAVVMQDDVYVRVADPNDPAPTPTCS
jgi:prepilin-type N-terminal cleavage/methylation domain-containing protein